MWMTVNEAIALEGTEQGGETQQNLYDYNLLSLGVGEFVWL